MSPVCESSEQVMPCAVAHVWEEEIGGRPKDDEVSVKKKKRKAETPLKEEDQTKRKCSSPFRPWTPQEEPLPLVAKRSPSPDSSSGSGQRRNYKNMTRERRIEANARERTRVHLISAAYESLRRAVPAYSHNQKLSKLGVLRIAASYILTLSRVLGEDYSADQSNPSVEECIDSVTNIIQMEGKLKKK